MLKVKRWQISLPPSNSLESKIRFIWDFELPPQPRDLICLDGTGYEVSLQMESRKTDFVLGCTEGDEDILRIVHDLRNIVYGFNKIDYDLYDALQKKQSARAIQFVKQGANPEFFTDDGEQSWGHAVGLGNLELLELILDKHPKMILHGLPIYSAASIGKSSVVRLMIQRGADINEGSVYEQTPLIAATDYPDEALEIIGATPGDFELVVKQLINAGADLDRRDHGGNTALMSAISNKHQRIAMELIEAGADLNIVDNCGNTALIQAAKNGDQLISEMLIRAGADKKPINSEGKTAMDYAVEKGFREIMRLLN